MPRACSPGGREAGGSEGALGSEVEVTVFEARQTTYRKARALQTAFKIIIQNSLWVCFKLVWTSLCILLGLISDF